MKKEIWYILFLLLGLAILALLAGEKSAPAAAPAPSAGVPFRFTAPINDNPAGELAHQMIRERAAARRLADDLRDACDN